MATLLTIIIYLYYSAIDRFGYVIRTGFKGALQLIPTTAIDHMGEVKTRFEGASRLTLDTFGLITH